MSLDFKRSWIFNRQSLPMILQDELADCGHACVAMVSNYWGHKFAFWQLRQQVPPSVRGINLRELINGLEPLGLKTRALRVPLSEVHLIQ